MHAALSLCVKRVDRRSDFRLFDARLMVWNHFAGDGSWVIEEMCDDPEVVKLCGTSFEAVWDRATPHEEYQPA